MKTIAFVPARCGSKSIRLKNIRPFCGEPLIYWNLLALENTQGVDEIYVATDCHEIRETVLGFGFQKVQVYDREAANANDTASTESVMLEFIEKQNLAPEDRFILVQATSPFTQQKDFEKALLEFPKGDSLLSCVRIKRFFWTMDGKPINYDYKNRPRRQDFDGQFMENGAFYINTVANILKDKNRLSGSISVYEMEEFTAVEIDEPDDWIVAEALMKKHILKTKGIPKIKLFLTDVDGVLTDAGMYYAESGEEMKKFNTHDGKGIELLRNAGIKTGIITSENSNMVRNRAKKLKIDFVYQGVHGKGKLDAAKEICKTLGVSLADTAYIGDDINCIELLTNVGIAACPSNALPRVKALPGIIQLSTAGGEGAVRSYVELLLQALNAPT